MTKTINDMFLSKLCPNVQSTPYNPPHDDPYVQMDDNESNLNEVTTYNENEHWKTQKPMLGM